MKIVDFSSAEGQSGAQICFQEARKLRKKELDEESAKELPRSSQDMGHFLCRSLMSSQAARRSPNGAPRGVLKSYLEAEMMLGEAQKGPPETFESLEDDLKMRNSDFHDTMQEVKETHFFSSPEGQSGAQICFQEIRT